MVLRIFQDLYICYGKCEKLGNMHIRRLLCIIPKIGPFFRGFSIINGYYEYYKQYLINVINNKKFVTFTGYYTNIKAHFAIVIIFSSCLTYLLNEQV